MRSRSLSWDRVRMKAREARIGFPQLRVKGLRFRVRGLEFRGYGYGGFWFSVWGFTNYGLGI